MTEQEIETKVIEIVAQQMGHDKAKITREMSFVDDLNADSLDQVADRIFADINKRRFLIIPTKNEPMLWRIKRFFPSWYFRELIKRAGDMQLRLK